MFIVCLKKIPNVSPVVCITQPPTRVICEGLFRRGWNVERGPHRSQIRLQRHVQVLWTWVGGANINIFGGWPDARTPNPNFPQSLYYITPPLPVFSLLLVVIPLFPTLLFLMFQCRMAIRNILFLPPFAHPVSSLRSHSLSRQGNCASYSTPFTQPLVLPSTFSDHTKSWSLCSYSPRIVSANAGIRCTGKQKGFNPAYSHISLPVQ